MEVLTIVLSGLLGAIAPLGFILDTVIANNIKSRLEAAEVVAIRIDNAPSYQIIQGKANKIRIATRNLELIPEIFIDTLELETDPIDVSINTIREGGGNSLTRALREPLQGGLRLVLSEENINRAIKSPRIDEILQQAVRSAFDNTNYKLLNPKVNLLDNNRIAASATIDRGAESTPLDIMFELGINVVEGRKIELVDIQAAIGTRKLPSRFLSSFSRRLVERLDLARLENRGITARVLALDIAAEKLNVAAFISIENTRELESKKSSPPTEILR